MTAAVCAALGVSRASIQRRRSRLAAPPAIARQRAKPTRALSDPQQQVVLDLLHASRFADQAPAEFYASLLDEGFYHCSIRTTAKSANAASSSAIPPSRRQLGDLTR